MQTGHRMYGPPAGSPSLGQLSLPRRRRIIIVLGGFTSILSSGLLGFFADPELDPVTSGYYERLNVFV